MLSLPSVTLPRRSPENAEVQRLIMFLAHVDQGLKQTCELHLFGSSAVNFYLADRGENLHQTKDVDVTGDPKVLSDVSDRRAELSLLASSFDDPAPTTIERLHFQFFRVDQFFIGPDWRENLVSAWHWFGHRELCVKLLHPFDLILSKLERSLPRDLDDCDELYERYVRDGGWEDTFDAYFYQACPFAQNERVLSEVSQAYEDITGVAFDADRIDDDPRNI